MARSSQPGSALPGTRRPDSRRSGPSDSGSPPSGSRPPAIWQPGFWQPGFRQRLPRDKSDTLLLLLACCLVVAPHVLHLPLWISITSLAMLGWRAWITLRGERLPPRWLLLPMALLALPGVYASFQSFTGRDAGVALLVLLLTFKLLEMRSRRDLFVAVCLGFFLMLTNLFYSQSFGTALMMLAATIAIFTTQLSYQYTGTVPALGQRLRLCATIVGLALPLTLVLFFLFPRIQGPLWGMPNDAQAGRTGMSETMAPGNIAKLALSEEVTFRARFLDPLPPRDALYWRGVVLGSYDGRSWSKLRLQSGPPQNVTVVRRGPPVRYQITQEASNQRWLYALDLPAAAPQFSDYTSVVTQEMQLVASRPVAERVRYDLASVTRFALQPDQDPLSLQDWLDLPPGFNPQTHALAAKLRNQTDDNAALVQTVLALFHDQPFRYTLSPPLLGRDAIDDFLFETRAGFCEHYASAFVVLMRALDIPSRVVTGYQGGKQNPVDGYLTVRQSDAHAWAEVWLRGRGWVRVDPTSAVAPERIERNGSPADLPQTFDGFLQLDLRRTSVMAILGNRLDALGNGWNQWVLNYTPERQRTLLQSAGFDRVDWATLTLLMAGAGSIVMLMVFTPLLWRRSSPDPVERLYRRFCQRLARRGLARGAHEGPRDFAARIEASNNLPTLAQQAAAMRFLHLLESLRYGRDSLLRGTHRMRLIKQLKSLLSAAS